MKYMNYSNLNISRSATFESEKSTAPVRSAHLYTGNFPSPHHCILHTCQTCESQTTAWREKIKTKNQETYVSVSLKLDSGNSQTFSQCHFTGPHGNCAKTNGSAS